VLVVVPARRKHPIHHQVGDISRRVIDAGGLPPAALVGRALGVENVTPGSGSHRVEEIGH